jgi:hypothetical protein
MPGVREEASHVHQQATSPGGGAGSGRSQGPPKLPPSAIGRARDRSRLVGTRHPGKLAFRDEDVSGLGMGPTKEDSRTAHRPLHFPRLAPGQEPALWCTSGRGPSRSTSTLSQKQQQLLVLGFKTHIACKQLGRCSGPIITASSRNATSRLPGLAALPVRRTCHLSSYFS